MRTAEEIFNYLKEEGICKEDFPKLFWEQMIVADENSIKESDKTYDDFLRWYNSCDIDDDVKEVSKIEEFIHHISALWINVHDISMEAIEQTNDIETQIRAFVKLNAINRCLLNSFADFDIIDE